MLGSYSQHLAPVDNTLKAAWSIKFKQDLEPEFNNAKNIRDQFV